MAAMPHRAQHGPRTIVFGTDFSAASQNALLRTVKIAKQHDATIHVIHAAPRLPRLFSRRFRLLNDRKQREALDGVEKRIQQAGVQVRAHLMHGNAIEILTAKARAVAADLVVVGARGRVFPDSMIGSTAERLIAMDRHRVLLVRRAANRSYRDVVIAANEDSRLKEQVAAARLLSIAAPSVLHAYEGPFESTLMLHGVRAGELRKHRAIARREAEVRMAGLIEQVGLRRADLVLRHGNAARVLQRVDRDALLVLSRGRSAIRHLLLGSVTRSVVAYGASDLLLV
jgi:nucleotide-binding universal stress UspA family protein